MCNCEEELKKKSRQKYDAIFASLERFGYTIVRTKAYTLKGEVSKTNKYDNINWKFCPFCGEEI